MKFLIATKNKHKIAEFSAIFSALSLELISEKDLDKPLTEAEENGNTFEENPIVYLS